MKKFTISNQLTIRKALEQINLNAKNFLIVLDVNGLFVGLITEGDIRRSILSGTSIEEKIDTIVNRNPEVLEEDGLDSKKIKEKFDSMKVSVLPVIKNGILKDILFRKDLKKALLNKTLVVIMAGGFGKRMAPLTDNCPKPMLEIDGKPILEIILLKLKKYGFKNFVISLHHLPEKIIKYFTDGSDLGINISYVQEEKPLGTAGSLKLIDTKGYDHILLSNADVLTNLNFKKLIDYHVKANAYISVAAREYSYQIPFGVIDHENNDVMGIKEKPTITNFHSAGIYVLNPILLKSILQNEYLDMPNFIDKCIKEEKKISMFPFFDSWVDLGRPEDFEQASKNYKFSSDD